MLNLEFISISLLMGSFIVSYLMIPRIISIVTYKKWMDKPNERSSHEGVVPNLGGVVFFVSLMLSFYFTEQFDYKNTIMSIIPGLTVLFIFGLQDDLVVLGPLSKLGAQVLSALFLAFHYNLESLHGFMGIEGLSEYIAIPLVVIMLVTIINAVNLIDGIDGLASTVGIIMFSVFGFLFYLTDQLFLTLTCIVMIGSL